MEFPIYAETGFRGRKTAWVKNPDNNTAAYHVDYRGSNDLVIRRGNENGPVVGRVENHNWRGYVDIWFEDNTKVEMHKDGTLKTSHSVNLPASPGTSPFCWKLTSKWGEGNLKVVDAKGTELAFYARKSFWNENEGSLTITMSGISQQLMDQIIVTFMAVDEKLRRQRAVAAGAAAAA